MNREIKFKAWNHIVGRMSSKAYTLQELYIEKVNFTNLIFLEYIGLKDKNGVEIYEGDIVQYYSPVAIARLQCQFKMITDQQKKKCQVHGELFYSDACWWITYNGGTSNLAWLMTPNEGRPSLTNTSFEVIGNKYENKELLIVKL